MATVIPHEPGLAASLLVMSVFGAAALVAGAWVVQRDGHRGS